MSDPAVQSETPQANLMLMVEDRKHRAEVYRLLSRFWLREVDEAFAKELCRGDVATALEAIGISLPVSEDILNSTKSTETALEELAIDYCRIWIGPSGHISPLQSVAKSGLLQSGALDSMNDYLKYIHVTRAENQMLDHFGFQLEIMATILGSDFSANQKDSSTNQTNSGKTLAEDTHLDEATLAGIAGGFFRDHVLWARAIFDQARQRADTTFYQSVISATADLVYAEAASIGLAQ